MECDQSRHPLPARIPDDDLLVMKFLKSVSDRIPVNFQGPAQDGLGHNPRVGAAKVSKQLVHDQVNAVLVLSIRRGVFRQFRQIHLLLLEVYQVLFDDPISRLLGNPPETMRPIVLRIPDLV